MFNEMVVRGNLVLTLEGDGYERYRCCLCERKSFR